MFDAVLRVRTVSSLTWSGRDGRDRAPPHVIPRRDVATARRHDHTTGKRDRRSRRSTCWRSAMWYERATDDDPAAGW